MTRSLIARGGAASAFCIVVALAAVATAQTPYYFSGGTANWNVNNLNGPWYGGINTSVNPHTFTGSPTPWVNDGSGMAYIGYISSAGSGGANRSSVDSGLTNNETGKTITLSSSTATNAAGIQFSYDSSNGTVEQNSRYLLTGGTINLGNSGFVTDLSATQSGTNPYTTFSFGSTVRSDIVAAGGTLNVNCIGPNISGGSAAFHRQLPLPRRHEQLHHVARRHSHRARTARSTRRSCNRRRPPAASPATRPAAPAPSRT